MRLPAARAFALLALFSFASAGAWADCSSHPGDVAPGTLGPQAPIPTWTIIGDDQVDVQDVLALLNAAVGKSVLAWTPPLEPTCIALPGNLSPGVQDDGFSPPRWTPTPDGAIDVGDVLVGLRLAVVLIELDPEWFSAVVSSAQVADRVVAGSVIDSVASSGLPGVVVTALLDGAPVGETDTDVQGKFLLQGLPSGGLTLQLDGSASTAAGKFSSLQVEVVVDTTATTSVQPITLPDETDPAGANGKFTPDESGTLEDEVALMSDDGDIGLGSGPGGKIEIDGEPVDENVDLSVVPVGGEDLPEELTDEDTGDALNSTGEVAVGPAEGKFTGGGAGASGGTLSAAGAGVGFDLTLPNRRELPVGTMVDIWHWNGESWANCTEATGRAGLVIDLGGGKSAVRADGVATEGGLYAAALPIDLACVSSLSGFVTDQFGNRLPGVFVVTSLGASAFTDALGNFLIEDLPAYRGVGLGSCEPIGYELLVRAGVELGSATASRSVSAVDVFLGGEVTLGGVEVVVPDEGCVSGLVLLNDLPLGGQVVVSGPTPAMLTAGAQGRFFKAGLAPGSYRASFRFPGEVIAREFQFQIVARQCTTLRLAVNGGTGNRKLTVDVRYDHDGDLLTPSVPGSGAQLRMVGADSGSSLGLQAVADAQGRAVFNRVTPPYDLVAILERPVMPEAGLDRNATEGYPIMRLGAGLTTTAPLGQATLLLRLPADVPSQAGLPPASVVGAVSNLPALGNGEHVEVAPLRRGHYDEVTGAPVDASSGDYAAAAFLDPFDLAVAIRSDAAPFRVREMALFGPFQASSLPEGVGEPGLSGIGDELFEDLDYASGDRLVFRPLQVRYSNLVTSANPKRWAAGGGRSDGRSFWSFDGEASASGVFPNAVNVPPLSGTELDLFLELSSEPEDLGLGQSCIVPIRAPIPVCVFPPCLTVDFLLPPSLVSPAGPSVSLDQAVSGAFTYGAGTNHPVRGFDAVRYETLFPGAGPGEVAVTSFQRWLPAGTTGASTLGFTSAPFVFPATTLGVRVETYRSEGLPERHVDLFGPQLESILYGLPLQRAPTCWGAETTGYQVSPLP